MEVTVSKLDAAGVLLNRAIDAYLDNRDYISAIVLAGSSEDLTQGLLEREGRDASRAQMLAAAQQIAEKIDLTGDPASKRDTINLMRGMFNWLRHGDKKDDPDPVTWHLDLEAETIIYRALQNWDMLKGLEPARATEFVQARRASPA